MSEKSIIQTSKMNKEFSPQRMIYFEQGFDCCLEKAEFFIQFVQNVDAEYLSIVQFRHSVRSNSLRHQKVSNSLEVIESTRFF